MEDLVRKDVRLLSALSDLKLQGRKGNTKEGDFEERRKLRKFVAVKDDDEEVIYQPFIKIYRKKKPHDRKIISDCLVGHFTFSYLEESIRQVLLDRFSFCKVEEGQYLIRQGDNASCFFLLHEGRMSVEIDGQVKRRLTPADGGFGELALLFNAPRSASIRADTPCFLWYIDRRTFKHAVEEVISGSYKQNKTFIDKCTLLGELSNGERQALADIAMSQYYQKYSKICKEGELASSFYILKSGRIRRLREGVTLGFVEKGEIFEHSTALNQETLRRETLITEENSHVLALSISEVKASLGKSLHVVLLRNQLRAVLEKEAFFQKLSRGFCARILDSFMVCGCEKGRAVIDPYKKQKNTLLLVLQGTVEPSFPKFIPTKSQKLLSSIKDIRTRDNFDTKQLFGVQALRKAATGEQADMFFDFTLVFSQRGKVARSTLGEIEKALGSSLPDAVRKSAEQREERRARASRVWEMREVTKGYQLNQFCARRVLGSGAYGKVLLVTHEKQGLHFALKCISKRPLVKHKHLQFVKEEKETLSLVSLKDSPFFVKYYRSFRDNYYIYFLTEYIQGRDLFDVIRSIGILSVDQTRFYAGLLIHMLELFHQEGIIYRDLKPQNLMVGRDGYLKLVDMGTCKKMCENQTRTFSFIGTPEYMAPEVFIHKGYSFSADLWSLGAILYELLAGKNPFIEVDTEDMKEIYDQIMSNPLEFPSFMKDTSHPLMKPAKNLIAQLLDKTNPNNRLGGSYQHLRNHPFFAGFDWTALTAKTMPPAYYIKNDHLLNEDKIRALPSRSILTYLKDWNCELPKVKGAPEAWDEFFNF